MHLWSNDDEKPLYLITLEDFALLPDGFILGCIDGKEYVKGQDNIDDDLRAGLMAFGIRDPENHPQKDQIMWFLLKVRNNG